MDAQRLGYVKPARRLFSADQKATLYWTARGASLDSSAFPLTGDRGDRTLMEELYARTWNSEAVEPLFRVHTEVTER